MIRRRARAEPLSPEERRRSIIAAVTPLLVEHGAAVTTKQMAEAAGIAEGTIFRVFPDKRALMIAAVKHAMDPEPVRSALREIYPEASFEVKLGEAGRILLEHLEQVIALVSILRTMPHGQPHPPGVPDFVEKSNRVIDEALIEMFESHRGALRMEPARAVTLFRSLILAAGHPMVGGRDRLTVPEIVGVLTRGILEPVGEAVT